MFSDVQGRDRKTVKGSEGDVGTLSGEPLSPPPSLLSALDLYGGAWVASYHLVGYS